jgi:hypothetical protein
MNARIYRVVLDYAKRRAWVYVLLILFYFEIGLLPESPPLFFLLFGVVLGDPLLPYEMNLGPIRPLWSLPLALRELGMVFWWESVGLPGLLFTISTVLGSLAGWPYRGIVPDWAAVGIRVFFIWGEFLPLALAFVIALAFVGVGLGLPIVALQPTGLPKPPTVSRKRMNAWPPISKT